MTTVHFLVEGDFITDLSRDLVREGSFDKALNMVQCIKGLEDGDALAILAGKKRMTGWGICGDSKCKQCKGRESLSLIDDNVEMPSVQDVFKKLQEQLDDLKDEKRELISILNDGPLEQAKEMTKGLIRSTVRAWTGQPALVEDEEEEEEPPEIQPDNIEQDSGWLSPRGGWYSCGYMEHSSITSDICHRFGYDDLQPEDELLNRGWLKIGRYLLEKEITVFHSYKPGRKVTQSQIDKLFDWYVKHSIKKFSWLGDDMTYNQWLKRSEDKW